MFKGDGKGNSSDRQSAPQILRRQGKAAPSIIAADLVIVGTLTSTGDIHIDGRVDGEIVAAEVAIRGRVEGVIRARKVALAGTSHVEGTVLHEALSVEVGAFFDGNCRHSADPLSEVVKKPTFEPKRANPDNPDTLGARMRVG